MNPLDLLTKPLKINLSNPVETPKAPSPVNILPALAAPLPTRTTTGALPSSAPVTPTPQAPKVSPIQNVIQSMIAPLPTAPVRKQDWYDVLNVLPKLAGEVAGPVLSGAASLGTAVTGKPSKDIKIPTIGPEGRGDILDSQSSQNFYNQQLDAGIPHDKAFWSTAFKTVNDLSMLVPIARDVGKFALLKTAPEKLINAEVVSATRQEIRDFVSGADVYSGKPSPLPRPIQEAFKTASSEEKARMIKGTGIDLVTAKPSALGRLFGITEEEANALIKTYGGPVREGSAGALPGYRAEGGPRMANAGMSTERVEPVGFGKEPPKTIKPFVGFQDISTNILNKLEGRDLVSKQFIQDLTNQPELKQVERDLIRKLLEDEGPLVHVQDFAEKVHNELLPLERGGSGVDEGRSTMGSNRYEHTTLPTELRGPVANYNEHVYSSPIKTSAGNVHYDGHPNYFAHSRIEDLPHDSYKLGEYAPAPGTKGATRRVIEIQSDLFQKGRLESENNIRPAGKPFELEGGAGEIAQVDNFGNTKVRPAGETQKMIDARTEELKKLEPYRNTWHERVIREEVKQAAIDGKTKLQFPTGETAMKIEGLGQRDGFFNLDTMSEIKPEELKVGQEVAQTLNFGPNNRQDSWIITDVLGEGKFEAVPKDIWERKNNPVGKSFDPTKEPNYEGYIESFDISGKVDQNNPIYKFYDKEVGRYLRNKYGAEPVTDKQGVTWWEVNVPKDAATKPITAYSSSSDRGLRPDLMIPKEEATKIFREFFSPEETDFLITKEPIGKFGAEGAATSGRDLRSLQFKEIVKIMETNGEVPDRVLYHEAFEKAVQIALDKGEVEAAIQKIIKNPASVLIRGQYNREVYDTKELRAKELLADDFAEFLRDKKGYKGENASLWQKLLTKIREWLRKVSGAQKLYEDILSKKRVGGMRNAEAFSAPDEVKIPQEDINAGEKGTNKELAKESKANLDAQARAETDEHLGQLQLVRDDLLETLREHPAKDLIKYVSKETRRLPEVTGKETMKSVGNKSKETQNSIFGKRGDQIIEEAGFHDLDEAQAAVEDYASLRSRLNQATKNLIDSRQEIARSREEARDERSLTNFLNQKARETEKLVSAKDRATRIKREELKRQDVLKVEEARRLSYKERIAAAKMRGAENKSIWKKAKETLFPIKGVDAETKDILIDWTAERLIAKDVANETAVEMSKRGPQTMEEIIAFESGKPVPYIRDAMDEMGTQAKREGIDFPFKDNYLPHVYAESREQVVKAIKRYLRDEKKLSEQEIEAYMKGNELPEAKATRLKLTPFFAKARVFQTYSAAIKAGLTPKYRSAAKLIAHYQAELETVLANKRLLENLRNDGKLLLDFDAPDHWVPVTKRFSKQVYYAEPELAKLLNEQFRDEADLNLVQTGVKALAGVSRTMQEIVLSAGIPFTNINYFSTGQAIRLLTTATGELATGQMRAGLSTLKSSFAYIRANSNKASAKWFYENRAYLARMATEGIDISGRVGSFKYQTLWEGMRNALTRLRTEEGIKGKAGASKALLGVVFDKAFNERTFASMMSQVAVQTFKDSYDLATKAGATDEAAGEFAAKVVRKLNGIPEEHLRGQTAQDTLSATFFAPKFREGVMNVLGNTIAGFAPKNFKDAAFAKNRAFLLGAIITYGLYQYLNKKTSGKYTWQNPPGREFAWRIPLPNGQVGYVEFMPSFLAFPRNLAEGAIGLAHGDFALALQKFGSVFSMPAKMATELISNSDYFGREIYKDTDSGVVKLEKMAAYAVLGTSHPFIKETYRYSTGQEPLYQAVSYMLEVPVKYSTLDKENKSAFYDMLDDQTKKRAQLKDKVRPIYEKNQELIAQGKKEEAVKIYSSLTKNDKTLYDQIKKDAKTATTNSRKPFVNSIYENNQILIENGEIREATKAYRALSASDRKLYDNIKKTHELLND